jgi:hypothetical protein
MSIPVSALFVDSFDAEVKLAYQGVKALRETVRVKNGVIGSTHKFFKAGSGVATEHNRGNDVVAMNASRDSATATLTDWDAFDYVDLLDINKLSFDEKKVIANSTALAMGRREDQLIIDALEDAIVAGNTVGDGSAVFSLDLVREAGAMMDEANVGGEGRYMVYSATAKADLLNETEVTSSDYNSVQALVKGDIDTFYGFTFKMIGSRSEGGLPIPDTGERYNFAYHKQAVGLAIGNDIKPMVDWVAQKLSWQIGCVFSAGAVVIDATGMVCIHTTEA